MPHDSLTTPRSPAEAKAVQRTQSTRSPSTSDAPFLAHSPHTTHSVSPPFPLYMGVPALRAHPVVEGMTDPTSPEASTRPVTQPCAHCCTRFHQRSQARSGQRLLGNYVLSSLVLPRPTRPLLLSSTSRHHPSIQGKTLLPAQPLLSEVASRVGMAFAGG